MTLSLQELNYIKKESDSMQYTSKYNSPLGEILLSADEIGLTGLWFKNQKYYALYLDKNNEEKETSIIRDAKKWLDIYFSGKEPNFKLPLHFIGTEFQKKVWEILLNIPYGTILTYGDIANILAKRECLKRMSAQAVGGAIGHNQISIIVPCHRVVGTNKSLTGYAGGIERKIKLLEIEKVDINELYIPNKGTAL